VHPAIVVHLRGPYAAYGLNLDDVQEAIPISENSDAPYQVMINSHWAGPADQPDCPRYQMAVEELEKARGRIDMERLMAVMSSVQSSTKWTVLYDLEDRSLVLALPGVDLSIQYRFSLAESCARMHATAR
jgi:hypothetical protein